MTGIISTGSFPKALWPGIKGWFGDSYNKYDLLYNKMFDSTDSNKKYEEYSEISGFGLVPIKPEGQMISYDSETQGKTIRLTNVVYGAGYAVTQEEQDDNLYEEVAKQRTERLGLSFRTTKETVHANILNRADDSNYVMEGGDGQPLLSTAHPTLDGTQSNTLATPGDLSEATLEQLLIQIRNMKNTRGLTIQGQGRKLIIPSDLEFEACRILKSPLQNDSANNAVNAIYVIGRLPDGYLVNPFLTDTDSWFVKTDIPMGLITQQRKPLSFSYDNDFNTSNMLYKGQDRYTAGWVDFRGLYGSMGAA
jgi:hypothetical protein